MSLIDAGHEGLMPLVGDLTDKVVVLDWRKLNRRYQLPRFQLVKAKGGFGCKEGSLGNKVYGYCIADSSDVACRRQQLIGIATIELINEAMADTRAVGQIDLALREYMLVAKDGSSERGQTIEEARQRLKRITNSVVVGAYELHPESYITEFGFIQYPQGAPPTEVRINKGKVWTAKQ